MAWFTTDDGRRVNTDWFDEDEKKKYKQIEENKKEATIRNNSSGKEDNSFSKDEVESALKALDKLKPLQKKNPDIIKTPLSMKGNNLLKANSIFVKLRDIDQSKAYYEDVDINNINTLQMWVSKKGVSNTLTKKEEHQYSNDSPVGFKFGNEVWLSDGNHRASAVKLAGRKKIRVKIIYEEKGK